MHLCGGIGLLTGTDPKEHERRLKRKQKNRAAAQRSRQKHTDKADALHQHELLEKHNHTLQKEIQALQAELAWWSRILHVHERLCPMATSSCLAPGPAGCWTGLHSSVEQLSLFQTPASSPLNQQPSPCPQPPDSSDILPCPLPSLPLDSTAVPAPSTQPSSSPVLSPSSARSSLLGTSSELSALLPSPPQTAPSQPLSLEDLVMGKLGSLPRSPSAALGLAHLQNGEQKAVPAFSGVDWQGPGADPSPSPLLAFPLLSSAHASF
ncbi:basic leucine zipper transcriptional factor ATF-like 2 isoform X2 [Tamandua tetradactyla]|uniref:basic leucine zipper transcriptional factor ATF-like 2 isoform X2 n=1 Tax=Tamandua tetradactyla TaxID=48850 RepID=UPI0040539BC4